jgi:mono/diheme cytochrome c family protein
MRFTRILGLSAFALVGVAAMCQSNADRTTPEPRDSKTVQPAGQNRGQQVFAQNCSRCHNAPQGFSPRISGTIARHMRVRASLSEADYRALQKFLNP